MPTNLFLVFLGGGAGSLCRYLAGRLLSMPGGRFPLSTLCVNMAGCLLIGLLAGWLTRRGEPAFYLLAVTGFCGGFTTFSTFSLETLTLFRQGQPVLAVAYILLSVTAGTALAALGCYLASRP